MIKRPDPTILLAVLTAAVAAVAFWFLALDPKRQEAVRLGQEIAAKQAQLEATNQQIATYEQARAAYPANYAVVTRLGKAVPADDDIRSLMVQIDSAAKRSGVGFELIDVGRSAAAPIASDTAPVAAADVVPGATPNAAGFSTLPLNLAFEGSYFELSTLFTRLERFVRIRNAEMDVTGRLLLLQNLSLVPDPDKGFPLMRAEITATTYLVPAGEGITAGATAQAPAAVPPPSGAAATAAAGNASGTVGNEAGAAE